MHYLLFYKRYNTYRNKGNETSSVIVELLLQEGAQINALNAKGETTLDGICPRQKLAQFITKHPAERTYKTCLSNSNIFS